MEIARVEIPKHIRQITLSDSQRGLYFSWDGITISSSTKVPRAYFKDKNYYPDSILIEDLKPNFCITIINQYGKIVDYIKENKRLPLQSNMNPKYKYLLYVRTEMGYQPVLSNPKKVGTPRMKLISGQDVYNGRVREFELGRLVTAIKESYKPYISFLPVITGSVDIRCEIYDTIANPYTKVKEGKKGARWDVDNYAFLYVKTFPDVLVSEGKMKDDDRLHIPGNIAVTFHPIEDHENRKLVFIISQTTRPEIMDNEIYRSYHKNLNTFETEDLDLVKEDRGYKNITNQSKINFDGDI